MNNSIREYTRFDCQDITEKRIKILTQKDTIFRNMSDDVETCPVCNNSMCFERATKKEPPEYDVCNECGKHICINCSKDIDETPYCPECFKEKKVKK